MTLPTLIFGIILSTVYGTAFHFWKGGSLSKVLLYILLAWLGFWFGNFIGDSFKWNFASVGSLNAGMATLGSAIFLFIGEWLSRVEITHK
jgi:hypothetical protein